MSTDNVSIANPSIDIQNPRSMELGEFLTAFQQAILIRIVIKFIIKVKPATTKEVDQESAFLNLLLVMQMKELRPEVQHRINVCIVAFFSQEEPKKVEDALLDPEWVYSNARRIESI